MIRDIRWQLFKLASLLVKPPPLFTFLIGEPVVDETGHSLVGGPLVPGSELRFEPSAPSMPFDGCEHFTLAFGGNSIEIGIRDGRVLSVLYDFDLYRSSGIRRMRKLRHLLREHSTSDRLVEYVDNGSALLYASKRRSQFAAYAYLADTFLIYSTTVRPLRRSSSQEESRNP